MYKKGLKANGNTKNNNTNKMTRSFRVVDIVITLVIVVGAFSFTFDSQSYSFLMLQ